MCDYSLELVASRAAKVGDRLVTTQFKHTITRGFAEVGEPDVAVCILPGTELAFERDVEYDHFLGFFPRRQLHERVARFRQVNMNDPPSTMMRWSSRAGRWFCCTGYTKVSARRFCNCRPWAPPSVPRTKWRGPSRRAGRSP